MRIKGVNHREFKKKLAEKTGCKIQYNGWTCSSCLYGAFKDKVEQRDWRAVLLYRGDYNLEEINGGLEEEERMSIKEVEMRIKRLWDIMEGENERL